MIKLVINCLSLDSSLWFDDGVFIECIHWYFIVLVQYRSKLLTALTQLEALDGVDHCGEAIRGYEVLADIPGTELRFFGCVCSKFNGVSLEKKI